MNIFDVATSLENNVEAELEDMYKARREYVKEFQTLVKGGQAFQLKAMLQAEEIDQKIVTDYTEKMGMLIELLSAIQIIDRSIILLETGFDPGVHEVMTTDMDLPVLDPDAVESDG